MPAPLSFAAPTALEYFATLVADDASLPLVEAALALAQDDHPGLDIQAELARIDDLAQRLRRRIPADAVALQRLRWLNRYFFGELGFAGNLNDYHHPDNSYLHRVLATRRGIPITLAVLYIELATQIGLSAQGVSFPGHFLVKMRMQGGQRPGEVVIDPFTGQSLSREELDQRLAPYRRSSGLPSDFEAPVGLFLQSASSREVLARMLRNLKQIHRGSARAAAWLAVQDRLVILLPQDADERRDRGLAHAELGHARAALRDLQAYLDAAPQAGDRDVVEQRIAALGRGPTRLH
ncbi:MAG: tetratricopeptide repeat protein [Burkholderiaceae bacterium]